MICPSTILPIILPSASLTICSSFTTCLTASDSDKAISLPLTSKATPLSIVPNTSPVKLIALPCSPTLPITLPSASIICPSTILPIILPSASRTTSAISATLRIGSSALTLVTICPIGLPSKVTACPLTTLPMILPFSSTILSPIILPTGLPSASNTKSIFSGSSFSNKISTPTYSKFTLLVSLGCLNTANISPKPSANSTRAICFAVKFSEIMVNSILKPSTDFLVLLYSYFLPCRSSLPAASTSIFSRTGIIISSGAVWLVPVAITSIPNDVNVKLPIKSIRSPGRNKPSKESTLFTLTLRALLPNSIFSENVVADLPVTASQVMGLPV